MKSRDLNRHFIATMLKHLPPSASSLRLLDLDGRAGEILKARRADIDVLSVLSDNPSSWNILDDSIDAVVAYDIQLESALLNHVLRLMRAGGRFIIVLAHQTVDEAYVHLLENHGYVRILVEPALDDLGVLIRGEKAHFTDDTLARIQEVATQDADLLDLQSYNGRYVHLLIRQTPNKPVWKLTVDEQILWQAVAIERDNKAYLLGFSSLPKAVGFMQPAVMQAVIVDINKVGKFSKSTAADWSWSVLLNPTLESIAGESLAMLDIDPKTAEIPDE